MHIQCLKIFIQAGMMVNLGTKSSYISSNLSQSTMNNIKTDYAKKNAQNKQSWLMSYLRYFQIRGFIKSLIKHTNCFDFVFSLTIEVLIVFVYENNIWAPFSTPQVSFAKIFNHIWLILVLSPITGIFSFFKLWTIFIQLIFRVNRKKILQPCQLT